ncbi:MAG: sirohydrochlorin cobaltochelatase [Verrucomicrobiota bacterium]|jgi:sirohydrochlorin cobaltochelatase
MADSIERALAAALSDPCRIGQILIRKASGRHFVLCHRDDKELESLQRFQDPEDAIEIAKFDDAGNYRPLKTAPNLRHGWRLEIVDLAGLRRALDYFYPGRLAMFALWKESRMATTPLRETLNRQSGMYRVAANISDEQVDDLVGSFCRSDGGCLRTISWRRDASGRMPSTKLPPEKVDPAHDQVREPQRTSGVMIPLLCQEVCNLLVNEARKAVKGE